MRISQVQMSKFIGEEKEVNLGGAQMKTRVLEEAELKVRLLKAHEQLTPQATPTPAKASNGTAEDSKWGLEKLKLAESKKAQTLAQTNKDRSDLFVLDFVNEEM